MLVYSVDRRSNRDGGGDVKEVTIEDGQESDGLPLRLAFYLPQFHQTPENDAWHGTGFTEWTVVAQSRPLFPGHVQPELPGELGFYDLRLPETREIQAQLARSHGISGFCYYHYWFKGRRILDRPFREVLHSGKPDFPFCLCWANESWYRRWNGSVDEMVIEQEFDEEDDVDHIRWLIEAFRDERYIRVNGRPLLTIYRPQDLPNPKRTIEIWRNECARAGVPEPWLVGFETRGQVIDPRGIGFDAAAEFVPHGVEGLVAPEVAPFCDPSNMVLDYSKVASAYAERPRPSWIRYPCVATAWDNTPRRRNGEALVMTGSTPERYKAWLERAMRSQMQSQAGNGVVFINAWNEWAEGAHLEPDLEHGRAYLEATRELVESFGAPIPMEASKGPSTDPSVTSTEALYAELYESFVQLEIRSSAYLGVADRRVTSWRQYYESELDEQRATNRTLAEWSLSLERQVAFLTEKLQNRPSASSSMGNAVPSSEMSESNGK
jgi:hypothetical protein